MKNYLASVEVHCSYIYTYFNISRICQCHACIPIWACACMYMYMYMHV